MRKFREFLTLRRNYFTTSVCLRPKSSMRTTDVSLKGSLYHTPGYPPPLSLSLSLSLYILFLTVFAFCLSDHFRLPVWLFLYVCLCLCLLLLFCLPVCLFLSVSSFIMSVYPPPPPSLNSTSLIIYFIPLHSILTLVSLLVFTSCLKYGKLGCQQLKTHP